MDPREPDILEHEPEPRGIMRALGALAGVGVLLLAVGIIGLVVRVPYFSESPGDAYDVLPLIQIDGAREYPTDGRLLLTTVSFSSGRLSAWQYLMAWLDPDTDLVPEAELLAPGQTIEEENELQEAAMDQSQLLATAVALEAVGDYPEAHGPGALIQGTLEGCDAHGKLFPGNVVTEVDGRPVNDARDVPRLLDAAAAGAPIEFTVDIGKKEVTVDVRRTACGPDDEVLVGVQVLDAFPIDVEIDDAGVGGPSAGLMLALGIYDKLTPGDLTGGSAVAGTGQIDAEGNVYGIGGIDKKLKGAAASGAEVFFVPEANLEDARRAGVEDLRLVPVDSFDDAVAFLAGDTVASAKEGT